MNQWVLMIALLLATGTGFSQTARSYFDELYKAGGLDRMADESVCFADDKDNQNFFIFSQSAHMRELLKADGSFPKLPKETQDLLKHDFLLLRGYTKGVPLSDEETYNKDGDSWVQDGEIGKQKIRVRLSISWATLRYKRSVEILNPDSTLKSQVSQFGRCEVIPPGVQQKD